MFNKLKGITTILSLVFFDLISFYLSLSLALSSRRLLKLTFPEYIGFIFPLYSYFFYLWWLPFVFILSMAYGKLYFNRLSFWDETKEIIKSTTVSIVIILSIITLGKLSDKTSRLAILFLWGYSMFLFPIVRLTAKKFLYKLNLWKENIIIIGAGKAGTDVAKGINKDTHLGFNIVGFLDDSTEKIGKKIEINGHKYKVFGRIRNFSKFVNLLSIKSVIIALPSLSADELSKVTNLVQKYTKQVFLVPDLRGMSLLNTELQHLFTQQLFLLKINNNLKSFFNKLAKRIFDIAVSLLLLPILLLIIGIIGILIKLDSKGPVFFIQERLGKDKTILKFIKFRTMYLNSDEILKKHLDSNPEVLEEWEKYKKIKGKDPRVTRVGGFLRKTSLDELPQIFNVLQGKMSLVGPRPYLPREEVDMKKYIDVILMTYPGITGLWQVSGRNKLKFEDRMKLDTWYILNWSVWLDIVLLFQTIKIVFKRDGAY